MARKLLVAALFGLAFSVTLYAADKPEVAPPPRTIEELPRPIEDKKPEEDKKPDTVKTGKFGGRLGDKLRDRLGGKLGGKLAGKIDPERVKEIMDTLSKVDPEVLKGLMEKAATDKIKELIEKIDPEKLKAIQDALGKGSAGVEKLKEFAELFKKDAGK
jgi:hypothetical protein